MTDAQIFTLMRQIVMTVTGVPECILADQNQPAPVGEYATIKPKQSIVERGQANIYRRNTAAGVTSPIGQVFDVEEDIRAQVMAECSINFYRAGGNDRAQLLKQSNKRSDIQALLFRNKVGWNRADPVSDLTALQSNNWEQRSQISIYLMYETNNEITINGIYQATLAIQDEQERALGTLVVNSPVIPRIDLSTVTFTGPTRYTSLISASLLGNPALNPRTFVSSGYGSLVQVTNIGNQALNPRTFESNSYTSLVEAN